MAQLHLIDADEPLLEHTNMTALCGTVIERAEFELRFSEDTFRDIEDMLDQVKALCRNCRQLVLEDRYVYGIRPSSEKNKEKTA